MGTLWDRQVALQSRPGADGTFVRGEDDPEPLTKVRGEGEDYATQTEARGEPSEPEPDTTRARGDE